MEQLLRMEIIHKMFREIVCRTLHCNQCQHCSDIALELRWQNSMDNVFMASPGSSPQTVKCGEKDQEDVLITSVRTELRAKNINISWLKWWWRQWTYQHVTAVDTHFLLLPSSVIGRCSSDNIWPDSSLDWRPVLWHCKFMETWLIITTADNTIGNNHTCSQHTYWWTGGRDHRVASCCPTGASYPE